MDKYEALLNGLEKLIGNMQDLVATGKYDENEEMEKKDVSGVMEDVKDDMNEMVEPSPLQDEMKSFMKSKNLGSRPKGLKAVMIEAKVKKPMGMGMGMDMGFKKGKK